MIPDREAEAARRRLLSAVAARASSAMPKRIGAVIESLDSVQGIDTAEFLKVDEATAVLRGIQSDLAGAADDISEEFGPAGYVTALFEDAMEASDVLPEGDALREVIATVWTLFDLGQVEIAREALRPTTERLREVLKEVHDVETDS